MDDSELDERPSENRIREAGELPGITDFIVACPKDMSMFRAAASTTGLDTKLQVTDVIDLVAEVMDLDLSDPAEEKEEG